MEKIWVAQHCPAPPQDICRPSTTVDSAGCVITRGFVVPSRTASLESEVGHSTTSRDLAGGIFSLTEEAPPAFQRPSAPAPRWSGPPSASFHRVSKSAGSTEISAAVAQPLLDGRRQTWQSTYSNRSYSSRWEDDELAETIYKPPPRSAYRTSDTFSQLLDKPRNKQSSKNMRRTKSEQVNLKCLNQKKSKYSTVQKNKEQDVKTESTGCSQQPGAEKAIKSAGASKSDSEANSSAVKGPHLETNVRARVDRAGYAERRSRNDARAQCTEAPEILSKDVSLATPQDENAIESDGEGDDGRIACSVNMVTEALHLAEIHHSRNSEVATLNLRNQEERTSMPSSGARIRLSTTNIQLPLKAEASTEVASETPETLSALQRDLRPSRSRPRPSKGVLKSRSRSQGDTSKLGKQAQHGWIGTMSTHARLPPDDVAVHFTPVA